ncbi:hypothetical protein QCA50_018423 [Cerrena zonata]|uniref:Uncharacterized protein n=1 Tax=Cerrena zonata TaxID=2478898 RepID=A0AAW0FD50_9APHY
MHVLQVLFGVLALRAWMVLGQTQTVVDDLGQTVVEVVTTNALGLFTTQTLQTLLTTALTTATTTTPLTTAATTTTPDGQQGPVGQPATTPQEAGPTQYVYTTTDALGNTIQQTDTYTPTYNTIHTGPPTSIQGTILGYSQWLSMIGTSTATARNGAAPLHWDANSKLLLGSLLATLSGILGGAWMVLL